MVTTDFDKQTGIMSSTVATQTFNESMDANSSETKDIKSSGENTTFFGEISTMIPASLIGNGSSIRGRSITTVEGVTTLTGILNGSTDTTTNSQSGGSSTLGLAVSVTVPVVIIAAAVVLILICVFRKRRKEKCQLNFELAFPDPTELSSEHGAAFHTKMQVADVEDLDLQPTNIFMNQDILIKHDENFAAESNQSFNSQTNDTETVLVTPEKKSCDESKDKRDKLPNSEVGTITTRKNRSLNKASGDLSSENTAFELSENTSSGYSLAKSVEDDDQGNELSMEVEEPSIHEGADDGVYVAMGVGKDITVYGNSSVIQLGEDSQDSMYTNVVFRRVQSMQATSNWQNEQEEHVYRRVVSETQVHTSRPPIAQPRLTMKKKLDPYDFVPGTQLRKPDKFSSKSRKQGHVEEHSDGDDCTDLRAEELYMDMSDTSHADREEARKFPKI